MGRKPDAARRAALLEQVVAFLCREGIGELSLRPLARRLGTSTYALVYHFGSKEQLVAEALEQVERRQLELVERWRRSHESLREILLAYWDWATAPDRLPEMRLLLEATAVSGTRTGVPGPLRERLITTWIDLLARGLRASGAPPAQARARATLMNAALLGLVLDVVATGDRARARRGLLALLDADPATAPARATRG